MELQIKWNHLQGLDRINSRGLILPLAVRCFSLFRGRSGTGFAEHRTKISKSTLASDLRWDEIQVSMVAECIKVVLRFNESKDYI
jgi:hypothetical protein